MGKDNEARQKLLEIVTKLKDLRTSSVNLNVRIAQIKAKIKMLGLDARRIESATILEVHRAILDTGKPAYPDEWSKRARVEEILAKHERFNTLSKKHALFQRQLVRKEKLLGINEVQIGHSESLEQIMI